VGVPLLWEGMGTDSPFKVNIGKEAYEGVSPSDNVVKVKEMTNIMGTNSGNWTLDLALRTGAGLVEGRYDSADSLLKESNSVDVRVDQVLLVHQPGNTTHSFFVLNNAIENCNKIFLVKRDKNEASSV